ncbi:protein BANP-like isoform X2 [Ornithodoros turicata]
MASDEVPETIHLTVNQLSGDTTDASLPNLLVVDQLGEILGAAGEGPSGNSLISAPLRLISVGDGQFMLAKVSELSEMGVGTNHDISEDLGLPECTAERLEANSTASVDAQATCDTSEKCGADEENSSCNAEAEESLRDQLALMQSEILSRLDALAQKLDQVGSCYKGLKDKLKDVTSKVQSGSSHGTTALIPRAALAPSCRGKGNTVAVCVPLLTNSADSSTSKKSEVRLVSLSSNSYEDYPNGSWLGDPNNPDLRVRCPIRPQDLEMLNKSCTTPEKMALTLLDYLFDREVQASSNISGTGRHGKQQLDPMRIFGIRCHLVYHFAIGEKDWHRIKQNLDSKCRTAFRRKTRGMPLTVKAFRDRLPPVAGQAPAVGQSLEASSSSPECSLGASQSDVSMDNDLDLASAPVPVTLISGEVLPLQGISTGEPQIIHTEHGDIQVVHATAEEIAQLDQNQQIQILASSELLGDLQAQTEALVGAP